MSNRRERKKEKTQAAILESGTHLFVSKGYVRTAIKDIAHDCDIVIGTLYNYYKSKSELLQEIFRNSLPNLSLQATEIQQDNSCNIQEKIHDVMPLFMDVSHQFPRTFYRDLFAVMVNETKGSEDMTDKMMGIDTQFMSY